MRIAVLALQGDFDEHQQMLSSMGVESFQVRNGRDWQQAKDGLIIPGGESTAMMRIMHDECLFEPLREAITGGLPVFGTCAGLILLDRQHLNTMDITARRNAFGRQLGSFYTEAAFGTVGTVPMTFIRAPYIEEVTSADCEVLSVVDGHIVAARQGRQLATAFHPELTEQQAPSGELSTASRDISRQSLLDNDTRLHQYFLSLCE